MQQCIIRPFYAGRSHGGDCRSEHVFKDRGKKGAKERRHKGGENYSLFLKGMILNVLAQQVQQLFSVLNPSTFEQTSTGLPGFL